MSNKTNLTENVSQTSVTTKTSTHPTESVRQTAKHSKPKEHHKLTNAGININFHSPRITLMLIIFLMMLTVACLNHTALNTVTIIVFVLAELIAMVLPEIKVNNDKENR
ncbi:MAG TPA: hypothetical protein K8V88_00475 [Companilactobacillus farciminis]|uniref:Uncharacterized protein n=1 Tax=Companilactobacillus farciminis TaxID=1612 RepID=A0A921HQH0_9LACO|nr:hypothetical protein [Companilactobacillus farciminis]